MNVEVTVQFLAYVNLVANVLLVITVLKDRVHHNHLPSSVLLVISVHKVVLNLLYVTQDTFKMPLENLHANHVQKDTTVMVSLTLEFLAPHYLCLVSLDVTAL